MGEGEAPAVSVIPLILWVEDKRQLYILLFVGGIAFSNQNMKCSCL